MEINSLTIGDWVLDGNHIAQIVSVTCDGIIGTTFNESSNIEVVEPIPITPEILEKIGFRKSISPSCIHAKCYELEDKDKKYRLTIANYNKYKRLLLNIDSEDAECFNIKCDYVHQLQHALRLCGITKEIEIEL